ncbi:MAG: polyprenyl synthetase family protein [Treponema sp.]|nr:polyprenyl synthetase family protein [Treponema sp.]
MKEEFASILDKIEESIGKALPFPLKEGDNWIFQSFGKLPEAINTQYLEKLIEPNHNLISLGGKRWRPLLLILTYQKAAKENPASKLSLEKAYSLTPLVEFVHTASLIHDDIEDSADLRRGKPSAYITYGLDTALNAASWLYFQAGVCINQSDIPDALKITLYQTYTKELRKLHLGQAMDIYWHRNPEIFPSLDEYKAMVRNKTGTLACLSALIGSLAGGMKEEKALEIGEIAANIGIGFQIIDDVINLTSGNKGKKRGDDIVEGKKSLPVLLHAEKNFADREKIAILMEKASKEGIESTAVEECIQLLESSNSIKEAANMGISLIEDNCKKLDSELIRELFESMIPEEYKCRKEQID